MGWKLRIAVPVGRRSPWGELGVGEGRTWVGGIAAERHWGQVRRRKQCETTSIAALPLPDRLTVPLLFGFFVFSDQMRDEILH